MNNIINIYTYTRRIKQMNDKLNNLLEEIRGRAKGNSKFTMKEIDRIAESILYDIIECNTLDPTPIIKIAEAFGLSVYQSEKLDKRHSGNIHIHDKKCDKVGKDKIIMVDKNDSLLQQRFVIAHELGHYLFDYLGSEYEYNNKEYSCPYLKDNHEGESEQRANRFAAALLMPKDMFINEHNNAVDVDNRKIYVIKYLSKLFKVKESSIAKRIIEVSGETEK